MIVSNSMESFFWSAIHDPQVARTTSARLATATPAGGSQGCPGGRKIAARNPGWAPQSLLRSVALEKWLNSMVYGRYNMI